MKLLAALFAFITLLAAVLGFGMNAIPLFSMLGKVATLAGMAGFVITTVAHLMEESIPAAAFEVQELPQ
jgi:hypothetical protein